METSHLLLLRQLKLDPFGVVVIRYDLGKLEVDESLIATREGTG